jgi:hypothetical protein
MLPIVPLGSPIDVGHVGTLSDENQWQPVTTLQDHLHVEPEGLQIAPANEDSWESTSGKDVSFRVYAEGEASELVPQVANAKARTEVTMAKSESFVFSARNVTITSANNLTAVIKAIRWAYHERRHLSQEERWNKDWVYVFAVADAEHYAALAAKSSHTTIAAEASGDVQLPTGPAGLSAGVEFTNSNNAYDKANEHPGHHCFYRAYKLNPSMFERWDNEEQEEISGITVVTEEQQLAAWDTLPVPGREEVFEDALQPSSVQV